MSAGMGIKSPGVSSMLSPAPRLFGLRAQVGYVASVDSATLSE
jgi:hypothetical protein